MTQLPRVRSDGKLGKVRGGSGLLTQACFGLTSVMQLRCHVSKSKILSSSRSVKHDPAESHKEQSVSGSVCD